MPVLPDASVTALQIIKRSLKVRKVLGPNDTLSDEDAADCLASLNAFLKTLSAERSMIFQILSEPVLLASGASSRTIGLSGDFDTNSPTRLEDSFIRIGTQDYNVRVIDQEQYDAIGDKAARGIPSVMAYRHAVPWGTIYFYPTPDQACTLYLNSWHPLERFSSLTGTLAMPPEYEELLVYNFAMRLSEFGGDMPREAIAIASQTLAAVKGVNRVSMSMSTELGRMGGGLWNINNG